MQVPWAYKAYHGSLALALALANGIVSLEVSPCLLRSETVCYSCNMLEILALKSYSEI